MIFEDVLEPDGWQIETRIAALGNLAVVAHRHQLPIVSADAVFEQYGVKRVW
jgi:hypothetical protein